MNTHEEEDATIDFIQVVVEFWLQILHHFSDITVDIVALLVGLEVYLLKTPIKTLPVRHTKDMLLCNSHPRLTRSKTYSPGRHSILEVRYLEMENNELK